MEQRRYKSRKTKDEDMRSRLLEALIWDERSMTKNLASLIVPTWRLVSTAFSHARNRGVSRLLVGGVSSLRDLFELRLFMGVRFY